MNIPKEITRYLSRQKIDTWNIELKNKKLYSNVIIIPALDEYENIPKLLDSLSQNSKIHLPETLILVVVNNTYSAEQKIKNENQKLLKYLRSQINNTSINLGIIDASSKGKELSDKDGGVGLARKIGMDLALKLFDYANNKVKILIALDADCLVSENYLSTIIDGFNIKKYNAAVVNFEHIIPKEKENLAAIINYEIFLRYYVLALKYSKSYYSHLSVGSTIVCNAESYVKVGGMNKRKAGEDFYFLEKLRKITEIKKVAGATVFPSARISNRVPFGTGARIDRFLKKSKNEYLLYSVSNFEILKSWLNLYNSELQINSPQQLTNILSKSEQINKFLNQYLIEENFVNTWEKILFNTKSDYQLNKQKINWMDGFRTLKLIHYLRDKEFPNQNMFKMLNELFSKMNLKFGYSTNDEIPSPEIQLEYLKFLRQLT